MDYRSEVLAFLDLLEWGTLTSCEIAVWHAIHAQALKAGCLDGLSIAMETLRVRTGFSKKSIERARDALTDKRLICWKSQKGRKAPIYDLLAITRQKGHQNDAQTYPQSTPQAYPQSTPQTYPQSTPLYNTPPNKESGEYITRQKGHQNDAQTYPQSTPQAWLSDEDADILQAGLDGVLAAADAIGIPQTMSDIEKANLLLADYSAEWVVGAIGEAGKGTASARCWRYVEKVLKNWRERGGMDDQGRGEVYASPAGPVNQTPSATLEELRGHIPR